MNVHYWSIKNQENVDEPKEQQDIFNVFCNLNEDFEAIDSSLPAVNAFMIADGHGSSDIIARRAIDFFTNTFCLTTNRFPLSNKEINERFTIFHKIIAKDVNSINSGCTFLILFIFPHATSAKKTLQYQIVNLGDCRSIGFDTSGNYRRLTADHTFDSEHEKKRIESITELLTRNGKQKPEQIILDDGIHRLRGMAVSRTFGNSFSNRRAEIIENEEVSDEEYTDGCVCHYLNVLPDIFKYRYVTDLDTGITKNGSLFFVLGSDGLFDSLDDETVSNSVLKYSDVKLEQYFVYDDNSTEDHYGKNVYLSSSEKFMCLHPFIKNKKNPKLKTLISKPIEMDKIKIEKGKINIAERLCLDSAKTLNYLGEKNCDNITCIVIEIKNEDK